MTRPHASERLPALNVRRLKILHCYTVPWNDVPAGTANPLIIAVLDSSTWWEDLFAIHLEAERLAIDATEIPARFAELEKRMLERFYAFLNQNRHFRWLHWNMDRSGFGFPAFAQRFASLGGSPPRVPTKKLINLAAVLKESLGEDYAPHPRLPNLAELNNLNKHQWLSLEELTTAARNGQYAAMTRSAFRQVRWLAEIFQLFLEGRLTHQGMPTTTCPFRLVLSPGARPGRTGEIPPDNAPGKEPETTCRSAQDPGPAPPSGVLRPNTYLFSWQQILDALELSNNGENQARIRSLNELYDGPIVPPGRGGQPMVDRVKLLAWWNTLEDRYRAKQQKAEDTRATVEAQYRHGSTATVLPDLSGSVHRRRKQGGQRS